MKGILGRKLGMTQVFTEDGTLIPVTVVEACPNVVLQKKTVENDGYEAVQLGKMLKKHAAQKVKPDMLRKQTLLQKDLSRKFATANLLIWSWVPKLT